MKNGQNVAASSMGEAYGSLGEIGKRNFSDGSHVADEMSNRGTLNPGGEGGGTV